ITATVCALVLYPLFPDTRDEYLLVAIVGASTTAALAATFLTAPVPRDHLARFTERVRPPGWWRGLPGAAPPRAIAWTAVAWVTGNVAIFALLFTVGHLLIGTRLAAGILGVTSVAAGAATLHALRQVVRVGQNG